MLRRYGERAAERWRRLPYPVRDALGAGVLLVVALLPLGVPALQLGDLPSSVPSAIALLLTVAEVAPLALRRIVPALALALVGAAFVAIELTGASTGLGGLALFVALYTVAEHQRRARIITAAVTAVVYALLCFALHLAGSSERLLDWFTFAAVLAMPWLLGELVRRLRADQAERLRRAADDAVRAQRASLARELHDVVTHHVTAMVVQAESALYLDRSDVAERDRTFTAVGETGRLALTELRTLLDALDPVTIGEHVAPRSPEQDVEAMIARLRDAGYPVELTVPHGMRLANDERGAAVRSVVREAVTNAMKHARGQAVSVRLAEHPLELHVSNAMSTLAEPILSGGGRGLAGMARSVQAAGGVFEAGVHDGTVYVVSARWES